MAFDERFIEVVLYQIHNSLGLNRNVRYHPGTRFYKYLYDCGDEFYRCTCLCCQSSTRCQIFLNLNAKKSAPSQHLKSKYQETSFCEVNLEFDQCGHSYHCLKHLKWILGKNK